MIKSVCSVGYSAAQLFTRSAVFALLTGGKKIVPYESAGDVPSGMYDIALFNAQTGIAEAGISFGELQKKKCMPVVYSDEPLNRLLLQMFASDDRCSIVMCIGSREGCLELFGRQGLVHSCIPEQLLHRTASGLRCLVVHKFLCEQLRVAPLTTLTLIAVCWIATRIVGRRHM